MRGWDNEYNNLVHLIATLKDKKDLADILGRTTLSNKVRVDVELSDGSNRTFFAQFSLEPLGEKIVPNSRIEIPPANAADLGWGFFVLHLFF